MKTMRLLLVMVLLTGGGYLLGSVRLQTSEQGVPNREPAACWEATVYLPLADNEGRRFAEEEFQAALGVLVRAMGGATLIEEREGYWVDGGRRLCRESVRPVVVTFECGQLDTFRATLRHVGRLLGQEMVYYRLEKLHVELLAVEPGAKQ